MLPLLRSVAGDEQDNFINKLLKERPGTKKSYFQSLKIGTYAVTDGQGEATDLRLCMFNGVSDFGLLRMAADCGFPRGFPVVLDLKNRTVTMSGFYTKFANDDEDKRSFLEESKKAASLTVVRKWSGYLTSCVLYQLDGKVCYLVTSKKSADPASLFVQAGMHCWLCVCLVVSVFACGNKHNTTTL